MIESSRIAESKIGVAFAKLTALIRDSSEIPSRKLDTKTVKQIAQNGGIPKLSWEDSVEIKPKVIIMFDVGGSTDEFRQIVEELFAATKDHDEWGEFGTISDMKAGFDMYDLNLDGLEKAVLRLLENNLAR